MKLKSPAELEAFAESINAQRDLNKPYISICSGTGCHAYGCETITDALKNEVQKQGVDVEIRTTGCHGFCERGPLVVIHPRGIFYQQIKIEDVPEVISETILKGNIVEKFLYTEPNTDKKLIYEPDVPFYAKQQRLIFGNNGHIDPTSIEDYIALGGYAALGKVLSSMKPQDEKTMLSILPDM